MNDNHKHLIHYNDSQNNSSKGFIDIMTKHHINIGVDIFIYESETESESAISMQANTRVLNARG